MNWQTVKHFGKVKYFNISYVVILLLPIAKEIFDLLNLRLGRDEYLIPYTLKLLYAASLFYALGVALFQFFCPHIIKAYEKVQDYVRDNMDIYLAAYPDLKLQIIRTNLSELQKESREKIEELVKKEDYSSKVELNKQMDLLLPSCVQRYLTKDFDAALTKYQILMWLSLIFYIIGTLIVIFLLFRKSYIVLFN